MPSLFLKVFFWFWATVIATGVALCLTFIVEPRSVPSRWHATLTDTAHYSGTIAIETAERDGIGSTSAYLERLAHDTHMTACLFDSAGKVIAGTRCADFLSMTSHVTASKTSDFSMKYGIARVALMLTGQSGRDYIFATELPAGPRAALGMNRAAIVLQWGVALLVSGLICSLLTRYLTAPILRLQEMSQKLTAGELSVRSSPELAQRRDEIGDLVRDFNAMASRIEELVSRQRQLIYDISHELRSPLARLNVALDLARERKGNDSAFDHMEQDLERMSEMIGRMLTVAKLDTSSAPVQMMRVDFGELLSQVVRSAEFELRERDDAVRLSTRGKCFVFGNAELLQSAIENVIRNAARYTSSDASVDIHLERLEKADGSFILLSVRDYGVGVPESELPNIFRPFYRVANDRDRESGGAGLGLAIVDRVVRVHGGTIRAQNAAPQGLRVDILLPAAAE